MKNTHTALFILSLFSIIFSCNNLEEDPFGVYSFNSDNKGKKISHRILLDNNYLIETQYSLDPNTFVLTRGGYYKLKDKNTFNVTFEFNSNFENDRVVQDSNPGRPRLVRVRQSGRIFFRSPTLTACSFAVL